MRNSDKWQATKYVYRKGKLVASRDPEEVGVGSRLIADLVADFYDRSIRQYAKGKLIDLGCGHVPLFMAYRDYVVDITCVDWENTRHKNEYLDFECDLAEALPFEGEEFDTIILSDVLEHIAQPEFLWQEMSRILSKDGKIMMNVPFFYWVHGRPYDYYRYTEFALRRFVEISGLRLIQLEPVGGSPEIVADFFAKHVRYVPLIGKGLATAIQYTIGLFVRRTALGKRISQFSSQVFPLGYTLIAEKPK